MKMPDVPTAVLSCWTWCGFRIRRSGPLTDRLRHRGGRALRQCPDWAHVSTEEQERLKKHMASHDLVWIHGLKLANGFGLWRWPKTVLNIDDIPSSFHRSDLAQTSGIINKLRRHRQVFLWERREKNIVERFDAVCGFASDADPPEAWGIGKDFCLLPNGFDAPTNSARASAIGSAARRVSSALLNTGPTAMG